MSLSLWSDDVSFTVQKRNVQIGRVMPSKQVLYVRNLYCLILKYDVPFVHRINSPSKIIRLLHLPPAFAYTYIGQV
jgi:hypothetical protein